jgi:hypothetical protein
LAFGHDELILILVIWSDSAGFAGETTLSDFLMIPIIWLQFG